MTTRADFALTSACRVAEMVIERLAQTTKLAEFSFGDNTVQEFASKFRQVAAEETRVIHVVERGDIPLGEYGFLEFFCPDPACDCRRVTLRVTTSDGRAWASISFGWENARFYRRWAHDSDDADEMAGASLDPLNDQSVFAEWFLTFFREMVQTDRKYVERLKRHYRMFKNLPGGGVQVLRRLPIHRSGRA